MTNKKHGKIPTISKDRIDSTHLQTTLGASKEFHNFVKNKGQVKSFTTRLPLPVYEKLKIKAFNNDQKINRIICQLVEEYLDK
jgi:hypothetical protein